MKAKLEVQKPRFNQLIRKKYKNWDKFFLKKRVMSLYDKALTPHTKNEKLYFIYLKSISNNLKLISNHLSKIKPCFIPFLYNKILN